MENSNMLLKYKELKDYIDDETKNHELNCRPYLRYVPDILFKEPLIEIVYLETEYRGHSGDSDCVISGKVKLEEGLECVRAYIWELKAPQCFLFEKDTENRLRPSPDLVKAENQLLHYFHENIGSDHFKNDFQITHPDHVKLGGIIIGCKRTLVKGIAEEEKKKKLYEKATMIRRKYFYDFLGIRLMTWDTVLDHLHGSIEANVHKTGEQIISIGETVAFDIVLQVK